MVLESVFLMMLGWTNKNSRNMQVGFEKQTIIMRCAYKCDCDYDSKKPISVRTMRILALKAHMTTKKHVTSIKSKRIDVTQQKVRTDAINDFASVVGLNKKITITA